jgi:UDP-perosamine 4-acetyltransferase
LRRVVLNVPAPPKADLGGRLGRLPYAVDVIELTEFRDHRPNDRGVVGFHGKRMLPLVESLRKMGVLFDPVVHERAILQYGSLTDNDGVIVDAGAIVGPWAKLGQHVVLARGASVGHDCKVGAYSFLGPSATLCGHVTLGEDVFVGAGSTILPDLTIGDGAIIGAGSVVRENVPARTMFAGVPAVQKKSEVSR